MKIRKLIAVVTTFAMGICLLGAQNTVRLWEGTEEKAAGVTLTSYLPAGGRAAEAVIVCPGGSYCWLDMQTEGVLVAEWLNDAGIAAFVLKYRTAGLGAFVTHYRWLVRGRQYPDMIRDIQRAVQRVREAGAGYGTPGWKVGVMGFSAGAHLAVMSGIYSGTNFLEPLSIEPGVSLRPDFVTAIYPVVTLSDERYVHKRSRRGLLGERNCNKRLMQDSLSLEKHVQSGCPPVFLINCMDDPVVKYQNSLLLDSALTAHGIPHKYILYRTGGHGFGANEKKGTEESAAWKKEFLNWLNTLFR